MQKVKLTIHAEEGLHARPAHLFCAEAGKYKSVVQVRNLTTAADFVNAKSILMVLTLGVMQGHVVEVAAEGEDELLAAENIRNLVEGNFAA
jgi:phosphocarrier protein